jgi:hypothetical protein
LVFITNKNIIHTKMSKKFFEEDPELFECLKSSLKSFNFIFNSKDNFPLRSDEVIKLINDDIENNDFDYDEIPKYLLVMEKYELYEVCDFLKTLQR